MFTACIHLCMYILAWNRIPLPPLETRWSPSSRSRPPGLAGLIFRSPEAQSHVGARRSSELCRHSPNRRVQVPNTGGIWLQIPIPLPCFGTRNLNYWVLGHSGLPRGSRYVTLRVQVPIPYVQWFGPSTHHLSTWTSAVIVN